MVFCKELKKEFPDKASMYAELKANKEAIIGLKKAATKFTDWIGDYVKAIVDEANKAEGGASAEIKMGDFVYPVINTTNWFDSHGDVHLDGIWDVSAKDQNGKTYYIINHELELGKVISYPQDVEIMLRKMQWRELGKDVDGETQALIFKVKLTEKGNADAVKAIMDKVPLQNSIRMRYVRIELCINDTSDYYKEEYANWLKHYDKVANKTELNEAGFFWAVIEAKIEKEGSAVLYGSNEVTPVLQNIEEEKGNPLDGSSSSSESSTDPSADSHRVKRSIIHNLM